MKRKLVYAQYDGEPGSSKVYGYVCVDEGDKAQEYLENARLCWCQWSRKKFEYVTDRKRVYSICNSYLIMHSREEADPNTGEVERCLSMKEAKAILRGYQKNCGGEEPKNDFHLDVWVNGKIPPHKDTENICYYNIQDVTGWPLEDLRRLPY